MIANGGKSITAPGPLKHHEQKYPILPVPPTGVLIYQTDGYNHGYKSFWILHR